MENDPNIEPQANTSSNISRAWVGFGLLIISYLLFAQAMDGQYNHDEEQYVFASLLAVNKTLYHDYICFQAPYYPLILSKVFSWSGHNYFFLARLVTWMFSVGSVLLIYFISRRITGDIRAAFAITVLFSTSTVMLGAFGSARNDIMPCFFALLGVLSIYESRFFQRAAWALCFLSGLAVTMAACTKVTYVFVPAIVLLYILICTIFRRDTRTYLKPFSFMLGALIGGLPVVYFAWLDWDNFIYDIYTFHTGVHREWYKQKGLGQELTLKYSVLAAFRALFKDTGLVCFVFIAFVAAAAWFSNCFSKTMRILGGRHGFLILGLAIAAIPFTLLPRPTHGQYFQPLMPFLLLSVASLYGAAEFASNARSALLLAMTVVASLPGLADLLRCDIRASRVGKVQSVSAEIKDVIVEAGLDGKIATLSPIRIIDAGLPVYHEFASGPFFFRYSNMLPPEKVRQLHGASRNMLDELFDEDPPVAIFTGYEFELDAYLEEYAREHGYIQVDGNFGQGKLFMQQGEN